MVNTPEGHGDNQTLHESIFRPWAERNGFSHAGLALIWIVAAFFLFQIVAGVVAVILVLIRMSNSIENLNPADAMDLMAQNMDLIFFANSSGQILFLGLATWFFCRLQVSKANRPAFLRFRMYNNTPVMIGVVIGLILAIQPTIWYLGWLNSFIPVPEQMESMQLQQMEMIEEYLTGDGLVWVALFNIGLVPAICEEILFRGYVLRSFEKSWGIWVAIFVSGLIFGLYHLQLANLFPLVGIGILLAFMTYVTQSLYPAMVAHFINNGASVLLGKYYPETAFSELSPETMPPLWMLVVSMVISAYLIYYMMNNKTKPSPQGVAHDE